MSIENLPWGFAIFGAAVLVLYLGYALGEWRTGCARDVQEKVACAKAYEAGADMVRKVFAEQFKPREFAETDKIQTATYKPEMLKAYFRTRGPIPTEIVDETQTDAVRP